MSAPRGFFGVGVEGISKPLNFGAVMRTAHAMHAAFLFSVGKSPHLRVERGSDTSAAERHTPYYEWESLDDMRLPRGCKLVAVELVEGAVELPQFLHPLQAAYLLGPEKGSVSEAALTAADHVVKIPSKFCVNVGLAAAFIMYDRMIYLGGYPARPAPSAPPPGTALWERLRKLP
ncbi:MAG: TrmH family RNA methyltransferase [Pseudomonadota bacterium]